MDTLAYLHLAATYESSVNPEPRTDLSYGLLFQVLDWSKCRSAASIPLFFFAIALFTVSFARPSLALEKGNSSPEVTSLQNKLQSAGYFDGPVTGYYGSLTQEAVSKFQQAKGLTANGIADEVTLKALDSGTLASVPSQPNTSPSGFTDEAKVTASPTLGLQKGNRSPEVSSLQRKLQAAGYLDGPATGYYGSLTQEAVTKFQQAKGLTANGIADEATLKALESSSVASAPSKPAVPQKVVTANPNKVQASPTQSLEKGNKTPEVTPSPTQSLEKGNKTPEVTPSPTQSLEKGNKTPEVTPSPTQSLEKGNKTPEVTPSPSLGLEKGNRSSEDTLTGQSQDITAL
jgi:peptidoglycan hydrolase-like protein with peptidoglycan-binding domain